MTTINVSIVAGRAPAPFALVDVGNPEWWICPNCKSEGWPWSGIPQALWKNCGLYGFRCHKCNHVWHYSTITIQRKESR